MGRATTHFLATSPGALGRGQKVTYYQVSITKSISKIFKPNFACLLTNESYKTYQTEFSFGCLGHALGVGLGSTVGGGGGGPKTFFPKFNQIWCVSHLHEWHMQRHNFFGSLSPEALGRGQNVKYH